MKRTTINPEAPMVGLSALAIGGVMTGVGIMGSPVPLMLGLVLMILGATILSGFLFGADR